MFIRARNIPRCVLVESNVLPIDGMKDQNFEINPMMNPGTETGGKNVRGPEGNDRNRERGRE